MCPSPLVQVGSSPQPESVQFLLGEGADPNAANDQGRSPLWRAAYNGHLGTVRLLLERGADPDMVDKQTREVGLNPGFPFSRALRLSGLTGPTSRSARPAQSPAMVGENEEVRELLEGWDRCVRRWPGACWEPNLRPQCLC